MLSQWEYVWNKYNDLVMNEFCDDLISEHEMERRLDLAEQTRDVENLITLAKEFGYEIKYY